MKVFKYRAKKGPNELQEGTLAAESKDDAISKVNELGLLPIDISETTGPAADPDRKVPKKKVLFPRVKSRDLIVFYRQLAQLVKSGVPILKALSFIQTESENTYLNDIFEAVYTHVQEGRSFSSALTRYPKIFSHFDISLLQAGEAIGKLDAALLQIAKYREEQEALFSKVRSAVAYPVFIIVMGVATVIYMLTNVIPQFKRFFMDLGQTLPLPTRMLIAASEWSRAGAIWIIIFGIAGYFLIRIVIKKDKTAIDSLILKIPKLGNLILKSEIARWSRTLEILLKNGMPILKAMEVAIPVIVNEAVKKELAQSQKKVQSGGYLSDGLQKPERFPVFAKRLLRVGEESGRIEEALGEIADWYERDTAETVKTFTNLLEPIIILGVGLLLGFMIIAVLLPVFSINAMIQ